MAKGLWGLGALFGGTGIVVGILIGALLFGGVGYVLTGGTNIPYNTEHSTIAGKYSVTKPEFNNKALTLQHLRTSVFTFAHNIQNIPGSLSWKHGTSYTQSVWAWSENGDIEALMTITGPENGQYEVIFVKEGYNSQKIIGPGVSVTWAAGSEGQKAMATVTLGQ